MKQIFHTWDKWECYPAGLYESRPLRRRLSDGMCRYMYACFLRDIPRFERALAGVLANWVNSCEHYLSNERMNRVAWLGQAAMCFETGVPAMFCGGYNQLSEADKLAADRAACRALNMWLKQRDEPPVSLAEATLSNVYTHFGEGEASAQDTHSYSAAGR